MDGDFLKGALFDNGKRLSSARHIKPKRNFSPDNDTSKSLRRSVTKKTIDRSEPDFVDCMYRSNLIQQISKIPFCVFRLPLNVFLVAKDNELIQKSLEDSQLSIFSEFEDLIDQEALTDVEKMDTDFEVIIFNFNNI